MNGTKQYRGVTIECDVRKGKRKTIVTITACEGLSDDDVFAFDGVSSNDPADVCALIERLNAKTLAEIDSILK